VNPNLATKTIVLLLAIAIVLTASISSVGNSYAATLNNSSINVSSAKLIWGKTYGGAADDRAFFALPVGSGYLVVGSTKSIVPNSTVGWVLRIDKDGNEIWNKTFLEGPGTEIRFANNLTDGFLLVGNEFTPSGDVHGYVAKVDNQGTLMWNTTIEGDKTNKLFSAIADKDGFVLLGATYSNGMASSEASIIKLDLNGNTVWGKTFGKAQDTVTRAGVLSPDNNYIVTGYTNSLGVNNYTFLLMKIDVSGNLLWNKTYGETGSEEAHSITTAPDGYVIVGDTQSAGTDIHAWVVKVDLNGNLMWEETVGGKKADSPAYVVSAKDGGYLVAGFTFSFGAGNRDFWLFKIDDSGKILWSCTQGDAGYQEAYSVIEAGENQYVMVGWTDPPGQPALIGKAQYDFYIVKIEAPKASSTFSNLLLIAFGVVVLAALLLALRLHYKAGPRAKTEVATELRTTTRKSKS